MHMYIVAIIIALTLIIILFFALRSTVKRIDYHTKKYFVDKLQDYDYLIEEKKKILDELNEKIEEGKKSLSENKIKKNSTTDTKYYKYYNNNKIPQYLDEELFKKYKDIKDKFSFNKKNLIKKFVNDISEDEQNYNELVILRKKFTNEEIYKIIKLRNKDQIDYVKNFITSEEFDLTKDIINFDKFKINDYITKLDVLIEKRDPIIYVYTGEKNKSYDYISPKIKTIFDENINEGIKISYKGILYDYSL